MLRVSLPSASSVPYPVGVKNAPKPAPPAWILAARFPCGTSSSSISPARYSASNTCESVCRGNEQMIFFTRLALSSAASPVSPLPALLLTIVRSLAPRSMRASISSPGMPAVPKPPIITVAPSKTSATAAVGETTVLSIMDRTAVGLCGGLEVAMMWAFSQQRAKLSIAPGSASGEVFMLHLEAPLPQTGGD